MKIVYFGEPYSFSHVAALRRYGKKNNVYKSGRTIEKTIYAPLDDKNSLAIVPIENTTGGIITETVDNMTIDKYLQSSLTIKEELELIIELCIATKQKMALSKIKKVYSHPYALKRSESWIVDNLPSGVSILPTYSTSDAVRKSKKESNSCAIASKEAIKYFGLSNIGVIKVEKGKRNLTRFFVIKQNGKEKKEF